jgi:hypothetical protein
MTFFSTFGLRSVKWDAFEWLWKELNGMPQKLECKVRLRRDLQCGL